MGTLMALPAVSLMSALGRALRLCHLVSPGALPGGMSPISATASTGKEHVMGAQQQTQVGTSQPIYDSQGLGQMCGSSSGSTMQTALVYQLCWALASWLLLKASPSLTVSKM